MAFHSPFVAFLFILVTFFIAPFARSVPFIVLHGIADQCNTQGTTRFTQRLSALSGSPGYCIEVGNGAMDSWFMPIQKHAEFVCNKVKKMKELSKGYNIVGLSQGNLIGRGVVQFCDNAPPVKNFISLAGPHAGTASVPLCGSGIVCLLVNNLLKGTIYSDYVQDHLTPAGYLKLPNDIPNYLDKCKFLPKLNNELPNQRNSTYKERFTSLQNLVLVKFEGDIVLIPKETSWFGYYPDGSLSPSALLPVEQTKLYIEDWIGLKTLNEAGRVHFVSLAGGHYGTTMSESDMKKHIVPFLVDQQSKATDSKARARSKVVSGLSDITSDGSSSDQ